jgi:hypothetical protein
MKSRNLYGLSILRIVVISNLSMIALDPELIMLTFRTIERDCYQMLFRQKECFNLVITIAAILAGNKSVVVCGRCLMGYLLDPIQASGYRDSC